MCLKKCAFWVFGDLVKITSVEPAGCDVSYHCGDAGVGVGGDTGVGRDGVHVENGDVERERGRNLEKDEEN